MAWLDRLNDALGRLGDSVGRFIDRDHFDDVQSARREELEQQRQEQEPRERPHFDVDDLIGKGIDFGVRDIEIDVSDGSGRVHMDLDYEIMLTDGEIITGHIERFNYDSEDLIRRMVLAAEGEIDKDDIELMTVWTPDDEVYEFDHDDFDNDGDYEEQAA